MKNKKNERNLFTMNVAISIILLISYLAFVIYIMKGGNLLMGFIMMSCVWIPVGVLGGQIDWATFNGNIMQTAPSNHRRQRRVDLHRQLAGPGTAENRHCLHHHPQNR